VTSGSLGATVTKTGIRFAAWSGAAERMWVSIFDAQGEAEIARHPMARDESGVFSVLVPGLKAGTRYGLRADGPYSPAAGLWFDPDKLLLDPYAVEIDRPYRYDAALSARRGAGGDTAPLVPKAIALAPKPVAGATPRFKPGGLVYEINVRAFTMRHPDVPEHQRGTVAALAHPAVIEHLKKLHVSAIELMPITAWIDERHLPPLGLSNAWGYNPVGFMALDPRLCPGGLDELRDTVLRLRQMRIATVLDLVFNHTGESDAQGPTLSLRGLDAKAYYRHAGTRLVNDTGTGNTVACDHPAVQRLVLDTLKHFVRHAGVEGFRFDLAPILGRDANGFSADAPLLNAMREDADLAGTLLIAEPWDIGSNGYQLGNFRPPFLEWNDRCRDDIRRFWRGDRGTLGTLATRLAGSSDIFQRDGATATRTVNFVAAHDGFALADLVRYERKHNEANGERNRDGHNENFSWNNGAEGASGDAKVAERRRRDVNALLATLFAARGAIMLTAGDEFGRSQGGNNNAYCQDNPTTWLDWEGRDQALEAYSFALSAIRSGLRGLHDTAFLSGKATGGMPDVEWLSEAGLPLAVAQWEDPHRRRLSMVVPSGQAEGQRLAVVFNGDGRGAIFALPQAEGWAWAVLLAPPGDEPRKVEQDRFLVPGRSVVYFIEQQA